MKPLIVNDLLIVDQKNEAAFYATFEKGINVVTSQHTARGKSSVLRAIAYSLGAEANYDIIFGQADKIFAISLSFNDNLYQIIRKSRSFVVFKNNQISDMFTGDVQKLSLFYEKEFGFSIYLTSRDEQYCIAPPGYSLIPFFLDQDSSWKGKDTNPFKMSNQFLVDLNDIYYFHTGVINSDYGKNKNKLFVLKQKNKGFSEKCQGLQEQIIKLKEYYQSNYVSISKENAEANLMMLKEKLNSVLQKQQDIQQEIFEKENLISKFSIEIGTMQKLLSDISANNEPNDLECPKCGFRFASKERQNYDKLLIKDNIEYARFMVNDLEKKIAPLKEELIKTASLVEEITQTFNSSKDSFDNYLKCQSISVLLKQLENDYSNCNGKVNDCIKEIEELENAINTADEGKKKCNSDFKDIYLRHLNELRINNIDRNMIVPFQKVKISGNKYIRSTLAFFVTILEIKNNRKFTNFNLPIIVDSPFEGDPDEIDKSDVIRIIKDFYRNNNFDSQLFIGLREAEKYFVNEKVNYLVLTSEEDHLLSKEMYTIYNARINRIVEIMSKKLRY